MEENEFSINSLYTLDEDSYYYIKKVIYIDDIVYILCDTRILAFNINTSEIVGNLKLSSAEDTSTKNYEIDDSMSVEAYEE